MTTIILDLDNCISDDRHRIPRINWQQKDKFRRYHDYHLLSAFDELGNEDLVFGHTHEIVIFTARPVMYCALTTEWLRRNDVQFKHLLMRNDDDHSQSVELKKKQLGWLTSLYGIAKSDIFLAVDDREDVVDMYKSNGVDAILRSIHNVCAYTDPRAR